MQKHTLTGKQYHADKRSKAIKQTITTLLTIAGAFATLALGYFALVGILIASGAKF